MKLVIGEIFSHNNLSWEITSLTLGPNRQVVSFTATTFNGRYYETNRFDLTNEQAGEAA